MRQLAAIAQRETSAFFRGAMAPVVLAGFLLLAGFFFTLFVFGYSELSLQALKSGERSALLNLADGVFQPLVTNMSIFLIFLLPAVSMRLFSEEYRSGRYDLVMTYPVPDHVWVAGKFMSVLAVAALLVLASGLYFAVAAWLGHPEPGPVLSAGLGLLLVAAVIAAWGVFFSTLFQYQVVSYILTFAFALLLLTIGGLEPHLPGGLGRVTVGLSLTEHFQRFARGVVDTRDLYYFAAWTALGLTAASSSLGGRRQAGARRAARWLPVAMLALLLIVLELILARHALTFDWTRNRRYSLSPQTVQVLASLDVDVRAHAFYQRLDPRRPAMEVLLHACRDRSPRFSVQFVDPDRELTRVQQFGVTAARTVVLEAGGRTRTLLDPDESTLINGVYRVASGSRPVVYHLLGHGQHRLDSEERGGYAAFARLLQAQGYDLRPLLLADVPLVPPDGNVLVIAAPKLEMAPGEIEAVQRFVREGGAVLALLDPGTPASLAAWTERYNVRLNDDFIVTATGGGRQFGLDPRVVLVHDTYGEHPAVRGLEGIATIFPFAQSLSPLHAAQTGVTPRTILATGPRSWGEADLASVVGGEPRFDEGRDRPGPLALGVALEIDRERYFAAATAEAPRELAAPAPTTPLRDQLLAQRSPAAGRTPDSIFSRAPTSRLIIVGDSDFAVNENLNLYGNRDLLLNLLSWLAHEQVLIALRPRQDLSEPVVLTVGQKEAVGWLCIVGWPLAVGLGAVGWVLRRRRPRRREAAA